MTCETKFEMKGNTYTRLESRELILRGGSHQIVATQASELQKLVRDTRADQVAALIPLIGATKPITHESSARVQAAETKLATKNIACSLLGDS